MDLVDFAQYARLTDDEPGIGGTIKNRPDDFLVDELPLYPPEGEGDHLYLVVEKRQRLTTDVVRLLAKHFKVPPTAVGYAGLKDKHAITRQAFTVEHADPDAAGAFEDARIRILGVDRQQRKLKRGHHAGNRFSIVIRDVDPTAVLSAKRALDRLEQEGVPNYFGEQRFGYRRNNHRLGRLLLLEQWRDFLDEMLGRPIEDESPAARQARQAYEEGDYKLALATWPTVHRFERQAVGPLSRGAPAHDAVHGIDAAQRSLLLSAFQSALFNQVVDRRLRDGTFATIQPGDVPFEHDSRRIFAVDEDPDALADAQRRYDAREVSPTGPMWGAKMKRAKHDVDALDLAVLEEAGVEPEHLARGEYQPDGLRRSLRMLIADPDCASGVDEHGPYVKVRFELGRGCFATTVLREIMKTDAPTP